MSWHVCCKEAVVVCYTVLERSAAIEWLLGSSSRLIRVACHAGDLCSVWKWLLTAVWHHREIHESNAEPTAARWQITMCTNHIFLYFMFFCFDFLFCFFFLMDCLKYGLLSAQEFFFPLGTNKDTLTLRIVFFSSIKLYLFILKQSNSNKVLTPSVLEPLFCLFKYLSK